MTSFFYFQGVHTYRLAMNAFGDLLGHGFVSKMNGYRSRAAEEKVMIIKPPNYYCGIGIKLISNTGNCGPV